MLTISRIKRMYGSPICRYCINEQFGTNLKRKNCVYMKHSGICPRCGKKRHIVRKLSLAGYFKVLGK